jgi:hypothetical protein
MENVRCPAGTFYPPFHNVTSLVTLFVRQISVFRMFGGQNLFRKPIFLFLYVCFPLSISVSRRVCPGTFTFLSHLYYIHNIYSIIHLFRSYLSELSHTRDYTDEEM